MGAEWMEEVEKARKKAEKLAKKTLDLSQAEEKKDALGNTIVEVWYPDLTSYMCMCSCADQYVCVCVGEGGEEGAQPRRQEAPHEAEEGHDQERYIHTYISIRSFPIHIMYVYVCMVAGEDTYEIDQMLGL